jgi:hypothetical protein
LNTGSCGLSRLSACISVYGSGSSMLGKTRLSVKTLQVECSMKSKVASVAWKTSGTNGGRWHHHVLRGSEHQGLVAEATVAGQQHKG